MNKTKIAVKPLSLKEINAILNAQKKDIHEKYKVKEMETLVLMSGESKKTQRRRYPR